MHLYWEVCFGNAQSETKNDFVLPYKVDGKACNFGTELAVCTQEGLVGAILQSSREKRNALDEEGKRGMSRGVGCSIYKAAAR